MMASGDILRAHAAKARQFGHGKPLGFAVPQHEHAIGHIGGSTGGVVGLDQNAAVVKPDATCEADPLLPASAGARAVVIAAHRR